MARKWSLNELRRKAEHEGTSMAELGRRGGLKSAARRRKYGQTRQLQLKLENS